MAAFAEEVGRSLVGAVELLQRERRGLSRFEFTETGFLRSLGAVAISAPAFVALVASERASAGLLQPGSGLFDDAAPVLRAAIMFLGLWIALPLVAWPLATLLGLRRRFVPFLIALNWTGVLGAVCVAVPAGLYAVGWATPGLAMLYAAAFLALLANLHWFTVKTALGVSGGVAVVLVAMEGVAAAAVLAVTA